MLPAGTRLPRTDDVLLHGRIEISPLTSLEGENLAGNAPKKIKPGAEVLL